MTRERILEAARVCLVRHGWERTSLREVAEEAGVAKGLVLYHFGTKEELFAATQAEVYRQLAERVAAAVDRVGPSRDTALWALSQLVTTVLAEREASSLMLELWAQAARDPAALPAAQKMREWMRSLASETMHRVLGEDAERLLLSVDALTELLLIVVAGLQVALVLDTDEARLTRSIAELHGHAGALLTMRPESPARPVAARRKNPRSSTKTDPRRST
ncbi:MAG: TetR/AcrR family transcriptional regulator [Deltaproteobacteria bacterium]|nr:TetR/AcrR family transcriptional regulator [Deltaproteobacteria bacterium]